LKIAREPEFEGEGMVSSEVTPTGVRKVRHRFGPGDTANWGWQATPLPGYEQVQPEGLSRKPRQVYEDLTDTGRSVVRGREEEGGAYAFSSVPSSVSAQPAGEPSAGLRQAARPSMLERMKPGLWRSGEIGGGGDPDKIADYKARHRTNQVGMVGSFKSPERRRQDKTAWRRGEAEQRRKLARDLAESQFGLRPLEDKEGNVIGGAAGGNIGLRPTQKRRYMKINEPVEDPNNPGKQLKDEKGKGVTQERIVDVEQYVAEEEARRAGGEGTGQKQQPQKSWPRRTNEAIGDWMGENVPGLRGIYNWAREIRQGERAVDQAGGKRLDRKTANQILDEAEGDPKKAREIARRRGYR